MARCFRAARLHVGLFIIREEDDEFVTVLKGGGGLRRERAAPLCPGDGAYGETRVSD